eukprot:CAMPEP_0183378436 /NCGR_PEP_ID=MMETSP0164_2-20130417/124916_1 /TAXON_ID=221442 /ORGANISM="Coccolithus pelagicus ssp braarudi, Strain PLY182g" /LENGTH=60 /DNA_ID=CAMNT_0025555995 /DNA_START=1036 /DNA_END=1215 /DNA_ORIENTATION=+
MTFDALSMVQLGLEAQNGGFAAGAPDSDLYAFIGAFSRTTAAVTLSLAHRKTRPARRTPS